jgi:hypothetical protein
MKYLVQFLLIALAMTQTSCGKKKSEETVKKDPYSADFAQADGLGCVQGTVVNGQTGQKINLSEEPGLGVFVLIRGVRHRASIVQNPSEEADAELAGEYFVCNIPLDESYLIFAQFNAHQPFQSEVKITSTTLTADENDLRKPDPILLANIRVFPKGIETNDMKITVVNDSKPIKGAAVLVEPAGVNAFEKADFLSPKSARLVPIPEAVTDNDGTVTISKDNLVLGASYKYRIIPPSGANLKIGEGTLVLGVSAPGSNGKSSYEFVVNLANNFQAPAIASCSNREQDYEKDGRITYIMNREVELVDLDDPIAALADVAARGGNDVLDSAELRPDADDNDDVSEQVKVEVKGLTITLSPKYTDEKKKPDAKKDPGLFITYDPKTIKFRVKAGEPTEAGGPISLESLLADAKCTSDVYFFAYKGVPKE